MRRWELNLLKVLLSIAFALVWMTRAQAQVDLLSSLDGTPTAAIMTDMNGDAMDDIVVTTENGITIYYTAYNVQTQSLELHPFWVSNVQTNVLASFDMDNNGQNDLVVQSKKTQTLYFLLNNEGDFSVHAETGVPLAQSIAVGMLNPDPYPDVVLGTSNGIFILWGIDPAWYGFNGNSWFFKATVSNFSGAVTALALKDMNNDGLMDIVVTTTDGRLCILFQEEGTTNLPSFTPQTYYMGASAHKLYVADINRDSLVDVLALSVNGINVFYGYQDQDTGFSLHNPFVISTTSYPTDLGLSDFNQDLILDMAVGLEMEKKIIYIVNEGQANFARSNYETVLLDAAPTYLWTGDFTFDGSQDVIYVSKEGKGIFLVKNISSQVIENLPPDKALPELKLRTEKENGYLKAYADFSVPDTWQGLPADVYLWNDCTYYEYDDNTTKCCVYTQKYKDDNTWSVDQDCQDISQGCPVIEVEPFLTSWPISTVNNVALFEFPLSVYPPKADECAVNVKIVIQDWNGLDYTIWKRKRIRIHFNPLNFLFQSIQ